MIGFRKITVHIIYRYKNGSTAQSVSLRSQRLKALVDEAYRLSVAKGESLLSIDISFVIKDGFRLKT